MSRYFEEYKISYLSTKPGEAENYLSYLKKLSECRKLEAGYKGTYTSVSYRDMQ